MRERVTCGTRSDAGCAAHLRTPFAPKGRAAVFLALAGCLIFACAARPGAGEKGTHESVAAPKPRLIELSAQMQGWIVDADPGRVQASKLTTLVTGDTLFFQSAEGERFVQIRIDGDFRASKDCQTIHGFACLADRAESRALEPGGIVSLCFHSPGVFKLTVSGGERTLTGFVEVRPR
jgi:hypothetical protein